jgi:hypothetical protein
MLLYILNAVASFIAFGGITAAIFSQHVRDGVLIKKGLASTALGFAANAINPTFNSQLWITASIGVTFIFIGLRIYKAKLKHAKPIFFQ